MRIPGFYFESIDHQFLETSRGWLEDAHFRDLIMAEPVNKDLQEAWFASLPHRSDYRIWGLKSSQGWVGACGIKNIDHALKAAEYWGYIYPTELRGKGFGREMFNFLSSQAVEMKVKQLWLRVSLKNKTAVTSYERWGFSTVDYEETGVIRMQVAI